MSTTTLALWVLGVTLLVVGYLRFRTPWGRYQGLRQQEANIQRYESWRGGLRTADDGPTGASVLMAEFRRQAQIAGVMIAAGIVLVVLGFMVR